MKMRTMFRACNAAATGYKPGAGSRKPGQCKATLIASANGGFRLASGGVWVQPDAGAIAA